MNVGNSIETLGKSLAVLAVIFGAGIAWQTFTARADETERAIEETRVTHSEDFKSSKEVDAKIAKWIEVQHDRQVIEDANLRALCAAKKLTAGAAYCETRDFSWGTD